MEQEFLKRLAIELWLKENQDIINGVGLDRRIGVPEGTIQKFLKYDRKLDDNRIMAIEKLLNKIEIEVYLKKVKKIFNEDNLITKNQPQNDYEN